MAFGRLVASAVADVAVSPPVIVFADGATMIVVGRYGAESVMVAVGSKLLPKVSEEETVAMMTKEDKDEVVVGVSVVTGVLLVVWEAAEVVMLAGSVTVVGKPVGDALTLLEVVFAGTTEPEAANGIEVLIAVRVRLPEAPVGRFVTVVLAVTGSSVLVVPPVPMNEVLFAMSVLLGVEIVMPVPGPVAEGLMV